MPVKQLSEDEYFELAKAALSAAGRDIIAEGEKAAEQAIANCKRVHRLLAVDGKQAIDLTDAEQVYAKVFEGVALASVEEKNYLNRPTGNLLPAVEVVEVVEGTPQAPPSVEPPPTTEPPAPEPPPEAPPIGGKGKKSRE